MARPGDPRSGRPWRRLVAEVITEEPLCWLRFPGLCTGLSETADHVEPFSKRPDLALVRSNLRGACRACNHARSNTPVEALKLDAEPATSGALSVFSR